MFAPQIRGREGQTIVQKFLERAVIFSRFWLTQLQRESKIFLPILVHPIKNCALQCRFIHPLEQNAKQTPFQTFIQIYSQFECLTALCTEVHAEWKVKQSLKMFGNQISNFDILSKDYKCFWCPLSPQLRPFGKSDIEIWFYRQRNNFKTEFCILP